MTVGRFDELIHAPTRLAIVSLLAATEWADFSFIRDGAGLPARLVLAVCSVVAVVVDAERVPRRVTEGAGLHVIVNRRGAVDP